MMNLIRFLVVLFLLFSVSSNVIIAANLRDGLVAYWPLDGNGDDKVGKSEGKLEIGAKWTNNGRVNGAVKLNGTTGYVTISGFTLTTNKLTSVLWLKGWRQAEAVNLWTGLLCSRGPMTFWMGFTHRNTLSYVWNNTTIRDWMGGPVIPKDEWAMLAITIDPDKGVAYVYTDADGLRSAENAVPHVEQSIADNLEIGRDECCGDRYILGIIDEVMIYNRALSEAEVLQLATTGLAVDYQTDKLPACWGEIKR